MKKCRDHVRRFRALLGDLGITVRVTLLPAPPILALLVLSALFLQMQHDRVQSFNRIAALSSLTTSAGALVHELQKERGTSGIVLGSKNAAFLAEMHAQRVLTAQRLPPLEQLQNPSLLAPGSKLAEKVADAQADLRELSVMRAHIDALEIPAPQSFDYYTKTIFDLLSVVLESGASAQDAAATRTFIALFDLMEAKERAEQERAIGAQGFAQGRFSQALFEKFRPLGEEQQGFLETFASYATDSQQAILRARLTGPIDDEVSRLRQIVLDGGREGQLGNVDAATWFSATTRRINMLREAEIVFADSVQANAYAEAQSARLWFDVCLAAVLTLITAIAAACIMIGRGLVRPIQQMTQAMTALASGDNAVSIPDPGTDNEIGHMGAAIEVFRANAMARHHREAQILHMARHDALTNLPNRLMLQERLEFALTLVGRGSVATVFCIDLDDFKAVNDTLGHFAGDQYLRIVAQRLQACVRETDLVARLGGDEFAIVQVGVRRDDDASLLADRLLEVIGRPLELEGQRLLPRLSIGIAVAPTDGTDVEGLMRRADVALNRAKADGGHTYKFFKLDMEARLQARRQLEADLHRAVASQSFALFYQPLVNAETSAIMGFEALVRWMHPTQGMVSPATFIPAAEETGLIIPLGEWILGRACADAVEWAEPLSVAVNLSAVQFKDANLVQKVKSALTQSGLSATRLELEITESLLLVNDASTIAALHALSELGVRISMDDFGTGYSSLSYLSSFPFDKIKIDQSFIRNIGVTNNAGAIVRAIVTLGNSLGMTVTAEGVETMAQQTRLRAEGCTQLQGYLFSKPRPAADIAGLIHRQYVDS